MLKNVKSCFKCGRVKRIEMFYKHRDTKDGYLGKCKECVKTYTHENYAKRRKQYSDYDKKRNQNPKRKASVYRACRRAQEERPERHKARMAAGYAVRSGKMVKQSCFYCDDPKTQMHHDDYSKPLDVRWVCLKCHKEREHGQVVTSKE